MQDSQELGWSHLTKKEKSALTLIVVNGRSKKEAATIFNISYYKFNELYSRARKMFILFKEYYDHTDRLVPSGLPLNKEHVLLFHFLLKDRKKFDDCASMVSEDGLLNYPNRIEFWKDLFGSFDLLNPDHVRFRDLLKEFDRWNRFRILPKKLQIYSPYLRRRNILHKKVVKSLINITPFAWALLEEKVKTYSPPLFYIPKVDLAEGVSGSIKASLTKDNMKWVTDNMVPVFRNQTDCESFAEAIRDFESLEHKPTHLSHRFWARFRSLVRRAINFSDIYQMESDEDLNISIKDRKFMKKSKADKSKKISIKPSRSGDFWV